MFTGIVEEVGKIAFVKRGAKSCRLEIEAKQILRDMREGDSVAVNGICLTVTAFGTGGFAADVMHETLNRSSIGVAKRGDAVNLERAMQLGGRFGGHIVTGHIDGTGVIRNIQKDDTAIWYEICAAPEIMRCMVEKGSVAVDGISLTVAKIQKDGFLVSVIPHTAANTALAARRAGDRVNLENDCIGKYVEKLWQEVAQKEKTAGITKTFLLENGF